MTWQPIETAPKDGSVFLAYWGQYTQFVAWVEIDEETVRYEGPWWWRRRIQDRRYIAGFRVLMPPARGYGFVIHGNFAPFTPTHWMPIPDPPEDV